MQNNELNEQQRKSVSKFFSLILRHRPEQIGLTLDKNGWADIDELLAKANLHNRTSLCITREVLMEIVATNDKKRFTVSEDGSRIRAAAIYCFPSGRLKGTVGFGALIMMLLLCRKTSFQTA